MLPMTSLIWTKQTSSVNIANVAALCFLTIILGCWCASTRWYSWAVSVEKLLQQHKSSFRWSRQISWPGDHVRLNNTSNQTPKEKLDKHSRAYVFRATKVDIFKSILKYFLKMSKFCYNICIEYWLKGGTWLQQISSCNVEEFHVESLLKVSWYKECKCKRK